MGRIVNRACLVDMPRLNGLSWRKGEGGRREILELELPVLSLALSVAKISSFGLPTVDGRLCKLALGGIFEGPRRNATSIRRGWMNEFDLCWLVEVDQYGYKKVKVGGNSDALDLMSFYNSLFVIVGVNDI